jgi:hypothetical protein
VVSSASMTIHARRKRITKIWLTDTTRLLGSRSTQDEDINENIAELGD